MFPSVWSSLLLGNKQALGNLVSLLMIIFSPSNKNKSKAGGAFILVPQPPPKPPSLVFIFLISSVVFYSEIIVNGTVFLISVSDSLSLVCRNITDFLYIGLISQDLADLVY